MGGAMGMGLGMERANMVVPESEPEPEPAGGGEGIAGDGDAVGRPGPAPRPDPPAGPAGPPAAPGPESEGQGTEQGIQEGEWDGIPESQGAPVKPKPEPIGHLGSSLNVLQGNTNDSTESTGTTDPLDVPEVEVENGEKKWALDIRSIVGDAMAYLAHTGKGGDGSGTGAEGGDAAGRVVSKRSGAGSARSWGSRWDRMTEGAQGVTAQGV